MAYLLLGAPPMAALSSTLISSLSFSKSQSLTCGSSLLSVSPASISLSLSGPNLPFIYCGRGDKKTARGKRFKHSFGNARPHKKNKGRGPPRLPAPPLPPRKDKYEELPDDDGEDILVELDESFQSD